MVRSIDDLKNLVWLMENGGEVSVGKVASIPCVAAACDDDQCLAILVKGRNESISELLLRLDIAVQKAWDEEIFTDEING